MELASLLRPSETSICQQFVRHVRLGVSEVVGVSEDVGEEDYVFSFAELSLPCGSGAIDGMMSVLSARRAEPLEVSWEGESGVWGEVRRRRWCGLSVGGDDDRNGKENDEESGHKEEENSDAVDRNDSPCDDSRDASKGANEESENDSNNGSNDDSNNGSNNDSNNDSNNGSNNGSNNDSNNGSNNGSNDNSNNGSNDNSNDPLKEHITDNDHNNPPNNPNKHQSNNNPDNNPPLLSNPQLLAELQRLTAGMDTSLDSMKLRDDSVEPDIETFRCGSRGNLPCRVCAQRRLGGVSAEDSGGNFGRRKTSRSFQCDSHHRFIQRMH